MASFAWVKNGAIVNGSKVSNDIMYVDDVEVEQRGIDFLTSRHGTEYEYVQTWYGGDKRKNYAEIGGTYDKPRDAFISAKPFPSSVLNEDTCRWEYPVNYPTDGKKYYWDEQKYDNNEYPWIEMNF